MTAGATQEPASFLLQTNAARDLVENGFTAQALQPVYGQHQNGLLREDDWEQLDREVLREALDMLVGVQDLRDRGLTNDLDGLGVLISQYERVDEFTAAEQSMTGLSESERSRADFDLVGVPVPVTFKDFRLDLRHARARERGEGSSLDTMYAEMAARVVSEMLEDNLFNGGSITLNGNAADGYTTQADRNTFTISTAWDSVTDNSEIITDAIDIKDAAVQDNYRPRGADSPYVLYIPDNFVSKMDEDLDDTSGSGETVRERILRINGIGAIRQASTLADDNVVLVSMQRDVVDWAEAEREMTVQWELQGGLANRWKVMSVGAPRVKSTQSGRSGIVHASV